MTKEEEREHITFVINLLRELDGDENIEEKLDDYYYLFGEPNDKRMYVNDIIKGLEFLMKVL